MAQVNFWVGLLVGVLSAGAVLATAGKFVLKAVVREAIGEMSSNWVTRDAGQEMTRRLELLEEQHNIVLKALLERGV